MKTVLRLDACAKINWALAVTGVREDGYHTLDMLMQRVSLCDTLYAAPAGELSLRVIGPPVPGAQEKNLVFRAAMVLRRFAPSAGARLTLVKRIPQGAGLGGGSADGVLVSADPAPSANVVRDEYAALSVYKQADRSTVQVGDTLTYTFTLTNTGTADATGVTLTDTFPAGFSVTSVSLTLNGDTVVLPAGSYTVDAATNTLTVPGGTAAPITVPAMTGGVPGVAVVTVTGTVAA